MAQFHDGETCAIVSPSPLSHEMPPLSYLVKKTCFALLLAEVNFVGSFFLRISGYAPPYGGTGARARTHTTFPFSRSGRSFLF